MNCPSLMSIESITFRFVTQTITAHGYYNSLAITKNSMDAERNIFSSGHFQNVDSALAESAFIGPGGALGKLPR